MDKSEMKEKAKEVLTKKGQKAVVDYKLNWCPPKKEKK